MAAGIDTAAQPSSMATVASDAVPTPASTITGTWACSRISFRFQGLRMPMPEPLGPPRVGPQEGLSEVFPLAGPQLVLVWLHWVCIPQASHGADTVGRNGKLTTEPSCSGRLSRLLGGCVAANVLDWIRLLFPTAFRQICPKGPHGRALGFLSCQCRRDLPSCTN